MLQFLNTERNHPRTEAYIGFENGNPLFLARIIQDVNLTLKALEIVYRENGAAVEGLADRNGHRRKVVGKGKSVRCGGARTKGEDCECELAKNMFFHSDLLKLCLMKRRKISEFFPDTTVFYD